MYSQILQSIHKNIEKHFGNKLRVRVCGVLIENNEILVVEHKNIGVNGKFISIPGGGLNFGESIEECLKREFIEETGLEIEIIEFLFLNEYLDLPLHAIELFYKVKKLGGKLQLGSDPEMAKNEQILSKVYFVTLNELKKQDITSIHNAFFKISE